MIGVKKMEAVNRILFISVGVTDDSWCLKQAIMFAQHNKSPLDILIISPTFPETVSQYNQNYKLQCIDQINKRVKSLAHELKLNDSQFHVEVTATDTPHINIVNRVLNKNYHLIIKKADYNSKGVLKALDMKLLRLAPCLVWLCKEINYEEHDINIAVAVDSESASDTEYDLSLKLLQLAKHLCDVYKGKLHVVSCYDTGFKCFMEDNNWVPANIENDFIDFFNKENTKYHEKFKQLIRKVNLDKDSTIVYCEGTPEVVIPTYINDNNIDILVMGSVSKLGVRGHFIGNTAENIIQNINCTLVTKKPRGFIAPV